MNKARELVKRYNFDLSAAESMLEHGVTEKVRTLTTDSISVKIAAYGAFISTIALIISILYYKERKERR